MENGVGPGVGDAEVALVGLALDQVGAGRLGDDHLRHPQMSRESPHLGLEQVADRIHRRRVVGVPGEVAQQPLGLVAGAEREGPFGRGEIEERDHAGPGHDVAQPAGLVSAADGGSQPVHRRGDVHRPSSRSRARSITSWACSRLSGLEVRYGIRTPMTFAGAQRLRRQVGHQRAVHAAGEPDHDLLEPAAALDLVAEELDQPAAGQLGVDRERVGGPTDRTDRRTVERRGGALVVFDSFPCPAA